MPNPDPKCVIHTTLGFAIACMDDYDKMVEQWREAEDSTGSGVLLAFRGVNQREQVVRQTLDKRCIVGVAEYSSSEPKIPNTLDEFWGK